MTPKELLYIEDALGHEKFLQQQCKAAAETVDDKELKSYMKQLASKHKKAYDKLYSLLGQ